METQVENEVHRQMSNMLTSANYQSTMNKAQVEFLFSQYSGTVFCYGHLRTIHADPITDNCFKIYTRSFA